MVMSAVLLQVAILSVSFIILLRCKKHLTIEPAGINPFVIVRWLSEITVHWLTKAPNFACSFTLTSSTILA